MMSTTMVVSMVMMVVVVVMGWCLKAERIAAGPLVDALSIFALGVVVDVAICFVEVKYRDRSNHIAPRRRCMHSR